MKVVGPATSLRGTVTLPGDKSISHRYAILAALARGSSRIANYSTGHDCRATLECLRSLGVEVSGDEPLEVNSPGWKAFRRPERPLDAGNSGTTLRLMAGPLAASPFASTIGGDGSLNRRPMGRIINPLRQMGARIRAREDQYPPLEICGGLLRGIRYRQEVPSAQVKSCLLLAGLMAEGETVVEFETPTRDHTERALPVFQVPVRREAALVAVRGPAQPQPARLEVPADFSAAVFFMVAALLVPGSDIVMPNLGVNPTRSALLELLTGSGARIEKTEVRELQGETVATLRVRYGPDALEGFPLPLPCGLVPGLIDEIPALAVLSQRMPEGLEVRGASELRVKESDRIGLLVSNLRSLGLKVEEFNDGFAIAPGQRLRGGRVRTEGDHRMAMALALAGLVSEQPVELDDEACVAVSFPGFFQQLERIAR